MSLFRKTLLGVAIALVGAAAVAEDRTDPSPRARVERILQALSTGDPAQFESVEADNVTSAELARKTPQARAAFVARLKGDFGHFPPAEITETPEGLRAVIHGANGITGIFTFSFEASAPRRISAMTVDVEMGGGGGRDDQPVLPAPPIAADMSAAQMEAGLDSWIAPMLAQDDFAGVVLIARDGKPFASRIYGLADREAKVRPDAATAYNIASIGKKFTQTAVARLIQEGRLSRETTIGQVLPDYPDVAARGATIEQLITMRGGIADFFGPAFRDTPKSQFTSNHAYFEFVSHQPQRFAPGTKTEYCNGCYIVLAEMVERASGLKFEDYVRKHVFDPAGMARTGYFSRADPPADTAILYTRRSGQGSAYAKAEQMHGYAGSGAGGAYSTALDLLAFDNALRDGKLLGPEMSAWVLDGPSAPGTNAVLDSDGHWTVIVTANVDPQTPERAGAAIARALRR